jgi:putative membrane protein
VATRGARRLLRAAIGGVRLPSVVSFASRGARPWLDVPHRAYDASVNGGVVSALVGPGEWMGAWALDPYALVPIVLAGVFYAIRVRQVGVDQVRPWRIVSFFGGLLCLGLAVMSPLDAVAETLFGVHMVQHLALTELAAPLVLLGLTGKVLRPLLASQWVQRLRVLSHPLVALPLWFGLTVFWLFPPLYELQLDDEILHAVAHMTFFASGLALWAPIVEVLPAPEWFGTGPRLVYLGAIWFGGLLISNVYWFAGTPFYETHETGARLWGISPEGDQANAGTAMMVAMLLIVGGTMATLFFRLARESELSQELIEQGHDRAKVKRAIRYRRAHLRRSAGG